MSEIVRYETSDRIAVVVIDSPPVNALSQEVRTGLVQCFTRAAEDKRVGAVVLLCAGKTFIAGADLGELGGEIGEPGYYFTFDLIEAMEKPVVAAIHGTALGGGVEATLACHYRVAARGARIGFPEINLGLVPGAGGTQRLPRLIGVRPALEMFLSGQPVDAGQALANGLVDAVTESDLREFALDFAEQLLKQGRGPRRTGQISLQRNEEIEAFLRQERERIRVRMPDRLVPGMDIDAVEAALDCPIGEGLKREQLISDASLQTTESKAMRRLFFAERLTAKIPGVDPELAQEVQSGGIIGAGTMGRGIAMAVANSGIPVTMMDVSQAAAEKGLQAIQSDYQGRVKRGRMSAEDAAKRIALISISADYADLARADVVIEAVFESMTLKKSIFEKLDEHCKPGAILASNTSTLDLAEIAAVTKRPEAVIGLHFFSPAHVMRLLEIVRAEKTGNAVIATSMKLAGKLRKIGVLAANQYGFIGNRMMDPYGREAERMLLEGATPRQIDEALERFGMAMGILAVFDLAGVDVGYKIRQERQAFLPDDPSFYRASALLVEHGMLGQKTGSGYYRYEPGKRERFDNPEALRMFADEAARLGIPQREISDQEIVDRCLYSLVNEGAAVLQEGVAMRASNVNVVYTAGYGFPRHRGGPMFYADTVGLKTIVKRIDEFAGTLDPQYWKAADLLRKLSESGGSIADYANV